SPAVFGLPWLWACQGGGRASQAGTNPAATLGPNTLPPLDELSHLLRRSRFALTAADLEAAQALGYEAYLEQQLQAPALTDPVYLESVARYPATQLPAAATPALSLTIEEATRQLAEYTVFLAAYSESQLYELVVDFWTNHFNIENITGELPLHKLYDDRDVIRRHAFGSFPEMLQASARSPAMMTYLNTVQNEAAGPNENYARELMELHTLGVDGGYTEQDVVEVARCFTGWAINGGTREFEFQANRHDDGEKFVLGQVIPAGGGVTDGETVLRILAEHPSTARFISTKLARRFVSDDPPASLINRLAAEFTRTAGDIPSLLRLLFMSEEFRAAPDRKFRRPLEFVAHLLRNTRTDHLGFDGAVMLEALSRTGQIPHRWFPPDGYPDRAEYWLNTASLLGYWNLAAELVENPDLLGRSAISGVASTAADVEEMVQALATHFVQRPLRVEDQQLLALLAETVFPDDVGPSDARATLVAGLLVASPYFSLR
ncbi:MAG: DUF1800 domain-containing protein, partial [Oceanococcaceae bacterium]